eukprot:scaffold421244_cov58-Attheya_sp.AAC.16
MGALSLPCGGVRVFYYHAPYECHVPTRFLVCRMLWLALWPGGDHGVLMSGKNPKGKSKKGGKKKM